MTTPELILLGVNSGLSCSSPLHQSPGRLCYELWLLYEIRHSLLRKCFPCSVWFRRAVVSLCPFASRFPAITVCTSSNTAFRLICQLLLIQFIVAVTRAVLGDPAAPVDAGCRLESIRRLDRSVRCCQASPLWRLCKRFWD